MKKLDAGANAKVGSPSAKPRRRGDEGPRVARIPFSEKTRRGARGLQQGKVPPIREKGDLAGFGMFDSRDPGNLEFRRTFQSASQFLRDFRKFHEGAPHSL